MEELLLGLFCVFGSLFTVIFLLPQWISAATRRGLVGGDMNKYDEHKVAEGGGITIIMGIVVGLALLIFIKTFILKTDSNLIPILGILATVLLAGFIGFVDDMLGWCKGISWLRKTLMTVPIALPLMVINVGHTTMDLPLIGAINFGLLYPLILVPIGIVGAAGAFNIVAGMNGLESGMGMIILGALGTIAFFSGQAWLALVCFIAIAALLGFLCFNWTPARVFMSDSGTYVIGALIGCVAILGNMEKIAIMMLPLYFLDIALYMKGRLIDKLGHFQAWGKPNKDDSLEVPMAKLYDSCHIGIAILKKLKRKVYERDVVAFLLFTQAIICLLVMRFAWL